MGFVNLLSNVLPNLGVAKHIILESTDNTIHVNSITVCNISKNDIRVSLVKKITDSNLNSKESFVIKDLQVKRTVNLVDAFGLDIFLPTFTENDMLHTTKLICYSNGVAQNFDLTVDYSTFIETPIQL